MVLPLLSLILLIDCMPHKEIEYHTNLSAPARSILDRYKTHIPCFNDDIQGTGCVTLAAITSGLRISKVKLSEMRMVIFGAGSAGTGIADQVRDAIAEEAGKSKEDAAKQIW